MDLIRYTLDEFPHNFINKPPMIIPLPYKDCMCPTSSRQMSHYGLRKDGFHVNLDVQQFKPEEVTVKHMGNCITVEGNHEEKPDEHGYIARRFVRRYVLPDDIDVEHVRVKLSSDGILSLDAPKVIVGPNGTERVIPINFTNAPSVLPGDAAAKPGECCEKTVP